MIRRSIWRPHFALVCSLAAAAVLGVACNGLMNLGGEERVALRSNDCVRCHMPDFEAAVQPVHVGVFPENCADCHSNKAWSPTNFEHSWPLEGAHASTACTDCHSGEPPLYEGTPEDCASCHLDDYNSSQFAGHDRFPTTCADCHSTSAWTPATASSHSWPLEGAHATTSCTLCHVGDPPVYEGTPTECVGCHQHDYETSTFPGHSSFSTNCSECHGTSAWRPAAGFDHSWPLEGAHATTACTQCHVGDPPVYEGTPTQCVGCHLDDYMTSPFPGHNAFSTTCQDCHTTAAWVPAVAFDHPWPLDGAHATTACTQCHVGNPPVYAGTPQACVACHQDDYDQSPFPGHNAFSTTCQDCHATAAWTPATGGAHPENNFPITNGPHQFACNDCHNQTLGPNGAGNADCVGCHEGEHTRARMDAEHDEVGGYPAGAAAPNFCLDCHADGQE